MAETSALTALQTARHLLHRLHEHGVRDVVLAPGSRSAPFAYALSEMEHHQLVRVHIRTDERVAGFTALGLSLGTGRLVPIITTSGTAVGELLPAVMEASHAGVRLMVLSADRPEALRGTGASQTTVQPGIFGGFVRAEAEIAEGPSGTGPLLEKVDVLIEAGTVQAGTPQGPVHLNVCFTEPLTPAPGWAPGESGFWAALAAEHPNAHVEAAALTPALGVPAPQAQGFNGQQAEPTTSPGPSEQDVQPRRTVVVAGDGAGAQAAFFATRHGLPLLAEPSSNARFGQSAIGAYRVLLPEFHERIERVALFGRPTLSRPVARLLADPRVEVLLYAPQPVAWAAPGRNPYRTAATLDEMSAFAGAAEPGWFAAWREADEDAQAALTQLLAEQEDELSGLHLAQALWDAADGNLVIGASNPIRDLDLVAATDWHPVDVYANRGLAGIDGTVSTAAGIALGTSIPTTVLLGDVTFLHDLGALVPNAGEAEPDLT